MSEPLTEDVARAEAQRRAEVQYAVSRVLVDALTVEQALDALLPAIADALHWDCAAVWLVDPAGDDIECAHAWSRDDAQLSAFIRATVGLRFARGEGLPGRAWASGQAVWLREVPAQGSFPRLEIARATGLQGGLAFPVRNVHGVVAVIECFTRHDERGDPDLLRLFEALGHQIGQFLQRSSAEAQVKDNEARYAAIVNGALDAIVAIDDEGHVTEFNPAAERLFGYSRSEAMGREMAELIIPGEYRVAHRAGLRRQRESGRSQILERRLELRACDRDGREFPVELTISRVPGKGRSRFIGFMRDITERREHEQERERLLVSERDARDEALEASRLKDEFLAAISHELRTPLSAVLGWSRMLRSEVISSERIPEIITAIARNAEAQKRVVDDLLDISAFVTGQMRLERKEFELREALEGAWDAVRPAAEAKRLNVSIGVPPVRLHGDRFRLQQVFWNLLANAVKFTPAGGTITVSVESVTEAMTVSVTDTGQGIDPAFLPFAFDRFRRGGGRHAAGLGLGLAIVRQIVEAHGGTVRVHSQGAGRGSTFTVTLPSGGAGV